MPLRAMFVNEGALGTGVVGHARVEQELERGLRDLPDVEARFIRLSQFGPLTRGATHSVPGLAALDLDLQRTRWHLMQSLRARAAVRRVLHTWTPDVLHVHTHTIAFALRPFMSRIPTFLSVDATVRSWEHMELWRKNRPWTDALLAPSYVAERRVFAAAAGVIGWSQWGVGEIRRIAADARVAIIHPGLDLEQFRPASRRPRERPRVLFVGGRFEEKGGGILLDALEPLLGRDVELDIVTSDHLAARTGVRVHHLDPTSDALVDLFQQADVFCLPTRADSYPWAIVEAMACGTPVVSTPVGAIPEIVADDAGVLVPVDDPRRLREAVQRLATSDGARFGTAARAKCEAMFDSRRQTAKLLEFMRPSAAR